MYEEKAQRSWRKRMDADSRQRGRERTEAHTRKGVILTHGAHSFITGLWSEEPRGQT